MREYKLEISGGEDFVIITPQMLSALIFRIHKLCRQKLVVAVKDIVPADMEEYLGRMINTNRHAAPCFHYCQISEDPITKRGLYRILRQQLEGLEMERRACFQSIVLADTIKGRPDLTLYAPPPFSGPAGIRRSNLYIFARMEGRRTWFWNMERTFEK